jgi:hypothetical protein
MDELLYSMRKEVRLGIYYAGDIAQGILFVSKGKVLRDYDETMSAAENIVAKDDGSQTVYEGTRGSVIEIIVQQPRPSVLRINIQEPMIGIWK